MNRVLETAQDRAAAVVCDLLAGRLSQASARVAAIEDPDELADLYEAAVELAAMVLRVNPLVAGGESA